MFGDNHIDLGHLKSKLKKLSETEIIIPDEITKNDHVKPILSFDKGKTLVVINSEAFSPSEEDKTQIKKNESLKNNLLIKQKSNKKNFKIEFASVLNEKNKKSEIYEEEQKQNYDKLSSMRDKNKNTITSEKKCSNDDDEKSQKKGSKLKFSTCELMFCILMPFLLPLKLNNKYKLYEKASEYLMKYINIFYLIRMVDDVQKMKSILLNNHQLTLFNYISKPIISLQEETQDNYLSNLEKVFVLANNDSLKQEIIQEIVSYYQELKIKGSWSLIDKRLFDYLDENFKKTLKMTC